MILDNPNTIAFSVETEARTITGLAVPFGKVAVSGGQRWMFSAGTLTWDGAKLLNGHRWSDVIGIPTFTETPEGLLMSARVANTRLGDEVLELAQMGAIDGLSIGLGKDVKFTRRNGVNHVHAGRVREVSTTPVPAFEDANIRSVAAQADNQEEPMEDENDNPTDGPAFSLEDGTTLTKKVDDLATTVEGLAKLKRPADAPAGPQFEVQEESLYRFDGTTAASGHDFSSDLIAGLRGDHEALARVNEFMSDRYAGPAFAAIDTGDTAAVNPSVYRPDMFLDEKPEMPTPLYNAFYAGAIDSMTPFYYSKLGEVSGLIDDHIEGVDPDEGTFNTILGPTVTPKAKSGRIGLTREVIDQGGNPQVSGLVLSKFDRAWRQMLETEAAAALKSGIAAYGTLGSVAEGADGRAIGKALKKGFTGLKFTADGQRFTRFFGAQALYTELVDAEDDMGRPLYPILAPANADGTVAQGLGSINVAGQRVDPTWSLSLGASPDLSFYADPKAVRVWNSGMTRLDKVLETAAGWKIDVFGYVATHVYDTTGVLKVPYTAPAGA